MRTQSEDHKNSETVERCFSLGNANKNNFPVGWEMEILELAKIDEVKEVKVKTKIKTKAQLALLPTPGPLEIARGRRGHRGSLPNIATVPLYPQRTEVKSSPLAQYTHSCLELPYFDVDLSSSGSFSRGVVSSRPLSRSPRFGQSQSKVERLLADRRGGRKNELANGEPNLLTQSCYGRLIFSPNQLSRDWFLTLSPRSGLENEATQGESNRIAALEPSSVSAMLSPVVSPLVSTIDTQFSRLLQEIYKDTFLFERIIDSYKEISNYSGDIKKLINFFITYSVTFYTIISKYFNESASEKKTDDFFWIIGYVSFLKKVLKAEQEKYEIFFGTKTLHRDALNEDLKNYLQDEKNKEEYKSLLFSINRIEKRMIDYGDGKYDRARVCIVYAVVNAFFELDVNEINNQIDTEVDVIELQLDETVLSTIQSGVFPNTLSQKQYENLSDSINALMEHLSYFSSSIESLQKIRDRMLEKSSLFVIFTAFISVVIYFLEWLDHSAKKKREAVTQLWYKIVPPPEHASSSNVSSCIVNQVVKHINECLQDKDVCYHRSGITRFFSVFSEVGKTRTEEALEQMRNALPAESDRRLEQMAAQLEKRSPRGVPNVS